MFLRSMHTEKTANLIPAMGKSRNLPSDMTKFTLLPYNNCWIKEKASIPIGSSRFFKKFRFCQFEEFLITFLITIAPLSPQYCHIPQLSGQMTPDSIESGMGTNMTTFGRFLYPLRIKRSKNRTKHAGEDSLTSKACRGCFS